MARYFRLEDVRLLPKEKKEMPPKKRNKYFCYKCECYHLIYSNIGNEHRDYNIYFLSKKLTPEYKR